MPWRSQTWAGLAALLVLSGCSALFSVDEEQVADGDAAPDAVLDATVSDDATADPADGAIGQPDASAVRVRMNSRGAIRMPPLASEIVDPTGLAIVDAWIVQLGL